MRESKKGVVRLLSYFKHIHIMYHFFNFFQNLMNYDFGLLKQYINNDFSLQDPDVHISLDDQKKINQFARCNAKYFEIKTDLAAKQVSKKFKL